MPPRKSVADTPAYSVEELLRVKHLGPSLIGEAMWKAAQELVVTTNAGVFGPALLATPEA